MQISLTHSMGSPGAGMRQQGGQAEAPYLRRDPRAPQHASDATTGISTKESP
jgi:hypothetical protein